jgi:anti-sigma B factor antagonist
MPSKKPQKQKNDGLRIEKEVLHKDILILHISGQIDAHTYEELEERLELQFDEDAFKIVLDMDEVDYMSSAGIGVLVGAQSRAKAASGEIVLMKLKPVVEEVFHALGVLSLFPIASDKTAALEFFLDPERRAHYFKGEAKTEPPPTGPQPKTTGLRRRFES